MKVILKYVLRNIREKMGRSILIIVSLMIASLVFILNLTLPNKIVEANISRMKSSIGKSDILVMNNEAFSFSDLKNVKEQKEIVGVNQNFIIHKDKTMAIYGTDIKKAFKIGLVIFEDLGDNEIMINQKTADKYNYKINDFLKLEAEDGKIYELKIKKIVEQKGLLFFNNLSGVINDKTYNNIFYNENGKYNSYYLDIKEDTNIKEYKNELQKNNKDFIVSELVDEEEIEYSNSMLKFILFIIFIMAIIMIIFTISNLNKIMIMERMPVIGTFRSIGATKKIMNGLLLLENVIYGLIGGFIGAILSLIVNNVLLKLFIKDINSSLTNPTILILGILFSCLLEIIMSIKAIMKSNKYTIKEIMFESKNSKYKINKPLSIISLICIIVSIVLYNVVDENDVIVDLIKIVLLLIGVINIIPMVLDIISKINNKIIRRFSNGSFILANKNLSSSKFIHESCRLVIIAITTILIVISVFGAVYKSLNSFKYKISDYDIIIRDITNSYEEYKKLDNIHEIKKYDIDYMTEYETLYNGKKFDVNPILLGYKDSNLVIVENNYKIKDLKEDEILIDEMLLKNNNLKIDNVIELNIKEIGINQKFKIVGTVDSSMQNNQRNSIIFKELYFVKNITKVPFSIGIELDKDYTNEDLKTIVNKIERELKDPNISILTYDEMVQDMSSQTSTIIYLFYVVAALVVILSFIGIINNQVISFMERTKELAMLNSICMSKKDLNKMLIIENLLSNILGCILGLLATFVSVKLIVQLLNGAKMYENVELNYFIAFAVIGIILVVLLSLVIIPIRKLKKLNIIEAIKYE